jgi:hypothetical protein
MGIVAYRGRPRELIANYSFSYVIGGGAEGPLAGDQGSSSREGSADQFPSVRAGVLTAPIRRRKAINVQPATRISIGESAEVAATVHSYHGTISYICRKPRRHAPASRRGVVQSEPGFLPGS